MCYALTWQFPKKAKLFVLSSERCTSLLTFLSCLSSTPQLLPLFHCRAMSLCPCAVLASVVISLPFEYLALIPRLSIRILRVYTSFGYAFVRQPAARDKWVVFPNAKNKKNGPGGTTSPKPASHLNYKTAGCVVLHSSPYTSAERRAYHLVALWPQPRGNTSRRKLAAKFLPVQKARVLLVGR